MCNKYDLSDFDGDLSKFVEGCYQSYLDFWASSPKVLGLSLQRNRQHIEGKEKDFWGMVEGHADKEIEIERYKAVPLLGHILDEEKINSGDDVLYFKRLYKRKIRIELFSLSKKYLVILQEVGRHDRAQFITAFPIREVQLQKKIKQQQEYVNNGGRPL